MKLREFNKNCRLLWGKIKKNESRNLTDEIKQQMLLFVVRNRGAIHIDLITPLLDKKWISSMGYLYSTNKFLHTSENKPN